MPCFLLPTARENRNDARNRVGAAFCFVVRELLRTIFLNMVDRTSKQDNIMYNRRSLKDIINCKTIPGEAVVSQHRLVVMDLRTRTQKKRQY